MWAHAFRTILKYKYKSKTEDESKKDSGTSHPNQRPDSGGIPAAGLPNQAIEDLGFDEAEGEDYDEEEKEGRSPDEHDEGDFMHASIGKPQYKPAPQRNHPPREESPEQDRNEDEEDTDSPKPNPREDKAKMGERMRKEMQTQEQEFRQKLNPNSRKTREAEVVEDEEDHPHSEEERSPIPAQNNRKEERTRPNRSRSRDSESLRRANNDADLNIDNIVKKTRGTKETIKLEMPSPKKEEEKESLPYFNGFLPKPKEISKTLEKPQKPQKPKKVVKVNKIVKRNDEEDLLTDGKNKYGKTQKPVIKDEWGRKIEQEGQSEQAKVPEPVQNKPQKREYVENVLANQSQHNGEDFEDNWDEEEGSPVRENIDSTKYRKINKENSKYRHPDIPMDKITKKKGKKKRAKVINKKKVAMPPPEASGAQKGDFD
eukprot:CAMPEP_0196999178 /NCGR_PEP_ID=MMETSP1380-20130617/4406_1 /TAXON_ID=5936 /ORGANISM="Euplotes crassus, Strain CT5" /LENGTH=427 /DNA_ID=CAMNT_0042416009 /DNA_START=290 /DNA_END=1571 /DNA_ORIENTATION=-